MIHGRLLNSEELKKVQVLQQSLLTLSSHIFYEIKDYLEKFYPGKVSHVGAPYEADHQLAALFHQGIIDYVYSIDSDLSVLGCDTIDNVFYNKDTKKYKCWFSSYKELVENTLPKAFDVDGIVTISYTEYVCKEEGSRFQESMHYCTLNPLKIVSQFHPHRKL